MVAPLKVGLAGLGTVGASVIKLVSEGRDQLAARCGRLTADPGVRLRWPDGITTVAVAAGVTGLGRA